MLATILARFAKTVNPRKGGRTQISDAVWRGQRSDVHEHATGTIIQPEGRKICALDISAHNKEFKDSGH